MNIIDDLHNWSANFQNGWLNDYLQNGSINWKLYSYVKNKHSPSSTGINVANCKLLLISSAGGYLSDGTSFDAENPLGDYSIRTFPLRTEFNELGFSHEHYDRTAVIQDGQVLLPLKHLQYLAEHKTIGEVSETVISFMGYQPDVRKVITLTIPAILDIVNTEKIDAALLVPS